jgi:hypothetical protein
MSSTEWKKCHVHLIFVSVLIFLNLQLFSQHTSDTSSLKLKSNLEIAFTPRFSGIKDYKISPTDSGYYYKTQWLRLQAGYQVLKSQYLHFVFDYYHVKTDLIGYEPQIIQ